MDENDFNDLLKIQRMMASRVLQESNIDNKIKLLDLINKLVTDNNKKVQTETVILEAQYEGLSERETLTLIEELKKDNLISEAGEGYLKRS